MPSQKNIRERDFEREPNTKNCKFCGRQYQVFGQDDGFCSRVCATQFHIPKEVRDFKNSLTTKK